MNSLRQVISVISSTISLTDFKLNGFSYIHFHFNLLLMSAIAFSAGFSCGEYEGMLIHFMPFSFINFWEVELQCNDALLKIKHSFILQSSFWWNLFQISPMNHQNVFVVFDSFHAKISSSRTDDTLTTKFIVNGSESMDRLAGSPRLLQL